MHLNPIQPGGTSGAAALLLVILSALSANPAAGGGVPRAVVAGPMRATPMAPAASGVFAENVTVGRSAAGQTLHGSLMVQAKRLTPRTKYHVNLSGTPIGSLTTDRSGNARIRFLARPRGRSQALSMDPRGRAISLSSVADDETVLEGEVDDPSTPGGIRCCLSTPDQQGCDSLLEADCTATGGTSMGAGSCEPDPCPGQADDEDGGADGETNDDGGQQDGEHAD